MLVFGIVQICISQMSIGPCIEELLPHDGPVGKRLDLYEVVPTG